MHNTFSMPEITALQPALAGARSFRLLRLSVTDLCNFRCRYCMPAAGIPHRSHCEFPSFEELTRMVGWLAAACGIERVRLTGGEPLVRPGIDQLIRQLTALPAIREVTLTTNGALLEALALRLKDAGLRRVNVSLDSVDSGRFAQVTRGGKLSQTLAGIDAARDAGFSPIKINTVLRRSTWKEDVPPLLDYAAQNGFEIRFIELMRTGTELAWCESEFIAVDDVLREMRIPITQASMGSRSPAQVSFLPWRGRNLKVGWITPRSHPFCARCDRLRMDARGKLRRCLMDPQTLDLRASLAAGEPAARLELQSYLSGKTAPLAMDSELAMSQIGG